MKPSARAAKAAAAEGDLVGGVVIEHGEHLATPSVARILLAHLVGHHAHDLLELNAAVAVSRCRRPSS